MGDQEVPARLLDLARQAQAPQALSDESLRARFGNPADTVIQVGQVWRARWDEVSLLLLILAAQARNVLAAPVTLEPPAEDEHCIVVEAPFTAFRADATVWAGMATSVPIRVLERVVDRWDEEITRYVRPYMEGRSGGVLRGAHHGRPILDEFAPSALMRAELVDDLEALIRAPGLPAAIPGEKRQDLASLLRGKIDLAALCAELDLSQPEVMRILRGKAPLTAEQMVTIARVTGLTTEQVAGSVRPLPLALVTEAEHPRWRGAWRHRARMQGTSEEEARRAGSYGVYALAARETGTSEPDWNRRLREFLRNDSERASGS